jgi:hypothetical protein
VTKRVHRGWLRIEREDVRDYCRERGVRGDDRRMFYDLLIEADDRTGAIEGDLGAIAVEVCEISRYTLARRLAPLEAAGVVYVERTNAPSRGAIVVVDYALLNPLSRLASSGGVERESSGSRAGVERESSDSATTLLRKRAPYRKTGRQEDRTTASSPVHASATSAAVSRREQAQPASATAAEQAATGIDDERSRLRSRNGQGSIRADDSTISASDAARAFVDDLAQQSKETR